MGGACTKEGEGKRKRRAPDRVGYVHSSSCSELNIKFPRTSAEIAKDVGIMYDTDEPTTMIQSSPNWRERISTRNRHEFQSVS